MDESNCAFNPQSADNGEILLSIRSQQIMENLINRWHGQCPGTSASGEPLTLIISNRTCMTKSSSAQMLGTTKAPSLEYATGIVPEGINSTTTSSTQISNLAVVGTDSSS